MEGPRRVEPLDEMFMRHAGGQCQDYATELCMMVDWSARECVGQSGAPYQYGTVPVQVVGWLSKRLPFTAFALGAWENNMESRTRNM